MSLQNTQRRHPNNDPKTPTPTLESYSKLDKPGKSEEENGNKKKLSCFAVFVCLGVLRYWSATSNIISDCDEVFNYWEPLHYVLFKSGFQTWEYSSQFALRSYLYILFHELVARPASWWFSGEKVRLSVPLEKHLLFVRFLFSKVMVFYAVRLFLGLISAATETVLVVALSRKYGKRLASYTLAMLCLSSGCFFASTMFRVNVIGIDSVGCLCLLPSSFSMYAVTLSSGLFLLEKPAMAASVAAAGVILGWPFSVLAVLPVTFYCLKRSFKKVFLLAAATSVVVLALSVLTDYFYYRRWTSSILNLLVYNVIGGGESHLYGTEGPLYYLRNGFNNFNGCFILALLFLGILPITRKKYSPDLVVVVSPIYIWIAFMSLQPHKEERFLYPVYPLICVAAAAVIESFPDFFRDKYAPNLTSLTMTAAKVLRPVVLALILGASHCRTFSLIHGYSAPLEAYKHLEHHEDVGVGSVVCVGSEWHRFPSSFFVPEYVGEVRWLDDGFRGLLPLPFNATLGGSAAAPPYFNNKNIASDEQYLRDFENCTFLVELQLQRSYPYRGSDLSTWEVISYIASICSYICSFDHTEILNIRLVSISGSCCISIPGQGTLASFLSFFLCAIFMAGEECLCFVQTAKEKVENQIDRRRTKSSQEKKDGEVLELAWLGPVSFWL
ncbi:hypothetical protein IFM89_019455 [Coptis chinensis]|uniref:Mannosyltransferase n=1 Tax=Coptis chinensis TaxID=261450 RepID=A0A835GXB0_9MAGN|nr:hypothetical protein IFM89_019455 [Coptis chinensis]